MFKTNLSNYQLCVLCVFSLVSLIILILSKNAVLVEQEFFEQDLALSYSFDGDTISTTTLWLINFFVMFFTFVVICCFGITSDKIIIYCFFLFNSIVLVDLITEYLKKGAGEPRPCAFYLCDYEGYAGAVDSGNYTSYYASTTYGAIGDFSKCNNIDAFMSWPSGHSSTSFTSMLASAILLHYNFEFQEPILNTIYYSLLIISTYIAISRVHDNKHHTYDVACGAIIGCVITLIMWQVCYTSLKRLEEKKQNVKQPTQEKNVEQLSNVVSDQYYEF